MQVLPKDIFFTVLFYSNTEALGRMAQVCTRFAQWINSEEQFWKYLVQIDFSKTVQPEKKELSLRAWVYKKGWEIATTVWNRVFFIQKNIPPKNDWLCLYQALHTQWNQAWTYEVKKSLVDKDNSHFINKKPKIEQYEMLLKYVRSKPDDCLEKDLKYTEEEFYWLDRIGFSLLDYAMQFPNLNAIQLLLKVCGNLSTYTTKLEQKQKALGFSSWLLKDSYLVRSANLIKNEYTEVKSQIFQTIVTNTQQKKLRENLNVFTDLLNQHKFEEVYFFLEAVGWEVAPLLNFQDHNDNNVLHLITCAMAPYDHDIGYFLLDNLNEKKEILRELMLAKNRDQEMPLHCAMQHGSAKLVVLFIQKLLDLKIYDKCMEDKNRYESTPGILLSGCKRAEVLKLLSSKNLIIKI